MVKNSQKEKKETLRKAPSKEKLINDLIENNHILQEKATEVVLAINKLTKKLDTMIDLFEEAAFMSCNGDIIVRMDCDDTHEPEYIRRLLGKIWMNH